MNQVVDFFSKLFETSDWPPRWVCGTWSDFHGWLYIGSDVAIWLAYFIIPVILIWFIQRRPGMAFLPVFWLFGAFILCCGATHLLDAIIFWWPAYRLSALVRLVTALVSMMTVFAIIRDLPKMLDQIPIESEHPIDKKHQEEIAQRDIRIKMLQAEIAQLRHNGQSQVNNQ